MYQGFNHDKVYHESLNRHDSWYFIKKSCVRQYCWLKFQPINQMWWKNIYDCAKSCLRKSKIKKKTTKKECQGLRKNDDGYHNYGTPYCAWTQFLNAIWNLMKITWNIPIFRASCPSLWHSLLPLVPIIKSCQQTK